MLNNLRAPLMAVCMAALSTAAAAGPRETLMAAAFQATTVDEARAQVGDALAAATAELARDPGNAEAQLQQALAIGYRAKLARSAADAKRARTLFQAFLAAHPGDPEAQLALAGWHLDAVADLGAMVASVALGASKARGLAALNRAVALGRGHALFPAYAALIRARLDPADPAAIALARQAAAAPAPTALDRLMQRRAAALAKSLEAGDRAAAATLARQMLPFGHAAA